jgi:hypothetical protein
MRTTLTMAILFILTACSNKVTSPKYPDIKWDKYRGTEESIKKYLDDNKDNLDPIEGIYSLSSNHSEKFFLGLLTDTKKTDDFARVAIIKDNKSFSAQFIEVIIRGEDLPKYAQTADFTRVQRSLTYLSKQFSPDGQFANYAFEYDESAGSLEGYKKDGDVTSKLLYLKLYPVK